VRDGFDLRWRQVRKQGELGETVGEVHMRLLTDRCTSPGESPASAVPTSLGRHRLQASLSPNRSPSFQNSSRYQFSATLDGELCAAKHRSQAARCSSQWRAAGRRRHAGLLGARRPLLRVALMRLQPHPSFQWFFRQYPFGGRLGEREWMQM
jgi:hypothetical protein